MAPCDDHDHKKQHFEMMPALHCHCVQCTDREEIHPGLHLLCKKSSQTTAKNDSTKCFHWDTFLRMNNNFFYLECKCFSVFCEKKTTTTTTLKCIEYNENSVLFSHVHKHTHSFFMAVRGSSFFCFCSIIFKILILSFCVYFVSCHYI